MNKFKTLFLSSLLLLFIFTSTVISYSTDEYEIYIPLTFSKTDNNSFSDNDGNNINIQIDNINNLSTNFSYSNKQLDKISEILESNISDYITETLNQYLTEEQMETVINSMNFSLIIKEITKFTKNDYKCFHFSWVMKITEDIYVYEEQYMVVSRK